MLSHNGLLQQNLMPQGLGTGALYTKDNFDSLVVSEGQLWYKMKRVAV
jgi:hypothetical protein